MALINWVRASDYYKADRNRLVPDIIFHLFVIIIYKANEIDLTIQLYVTIANKIAKFRSHWITNTKW